MKKSILKRKRVGRSGNALQNVLHEIAIMKKLNHPNVVRLYEVIDDPEEDKLYLVMELMPGGPVAVHSEDNETLPVDEARRVFRELINGLEYLHHHKILHRDIKPENILKGDDGTIKIGDFGVAYMIAGDDDTVSKTAGTPAFLSPESLTGEAYHGKPVDVWAAGITLYYFLFGQVPYLAPTIMAMYEKIQNDPLVLPREVEPELRELLFGMLNKDPTKRLTIPEIKTHEWVTNHGKLAVASAPTGVLTVTEEEIKAALKVVDRAVLLANLKRKMAKIRARAAQRVELRKMESGEAAGAAGYGEAWKVLSALDYLHADGSSIDLALFYPMPLDGETIKGALEIAAHAFRPVTAALGRRTLDGALVFTSSSIHFRTVYVDSLPDASCGREALLPYLDPVSSPTPPAGPAPGEPRRPFLPTDVLHKPLMRVRLSTLRAPPAEDSPMAGRHTCSILAISVARVVCDPPALCQFLAAWAKVARRLPFTPPFLPRFNVAPAYGAEAADGALADDEREERRVRAEADIARGCAIVAGAVEPPVPSSRAGPSGHPAASPPPTAPAAPQHLPLHGAGGRAPPRGPSGAMETGDSGGPFETGASAASAPAAVFASAASASLRLDRASTPPAGRATPPPGVRASTPVRAATPPAGSSAHAISLHGPGAVLALDGPHDGGLSVGPADRSHLATGAFSTFGAMSAYGGGPGRTPSPSPFDAVLSYLNGAHEYAGLESPDAVQRPHTAAAAPSAAAGSPLARPRSAQGSRPPSAGMRLAITAGQRPASGQRPPSGGRRGSGGARPGSGQRNRPASALSWVGHSAGWSAWGQPLVHVLDSIPPPYTASEAPPRTSSRLDFTARDLLEMMREADALGQGLSAAEVLAAYTWKTCVGVLREAITAKGSVVIATAGPPGGEEGARRAAALMDNPPPSRGSPSRALRRSGSFAGSPVGPSRGPSMPASPARPGSRPFGTPLLPPPPPRSIAGLHAAVGSAYGSFLPPASPATPASYSGGWVLPASPAQRRTSYGGGPVPRSASMQVALAARGASAGPASPAVGFAASWGWAPGPAPEPEETWLVMGVDLRERLPGVGPDFFGNASAWVSACLAPDALRALSLSHVGGLLAAAARRLDPAAASAYVAVAEEIRARAAPRVVLSGSRRKFSLVAPDAPPAPPGHRPGSAAAAMDPATTAAAPKGLAAPSALCRGAPPLNTLLVESFTSLSMVDLDFGRGAPYKFEHLTAPAHRAAIILPSLDGAAVRLYNL